MNVDVSTLGQEIKNDINEAVRDAYPDERRTYLGASSMGHECSAYLWYAFRWASQGEPVDGRMRRLYLRGHDEEHRVNTWLKLAGWRVSEYDLAATAAAGKPVQWRFSAVGGHYGGSCDAKLEHDKYAYLGTILGEYKTHNSQQFVKLVAKGIDLTHPKHGAQMNIYGRHFGMQYGLYFPVNKNDDDIEPEMRRLDWSEGELYERKAAHIITSAHRPERVSKTPTYQTCKKCPYRGPCHEGALADKNCRSCKHVTAVDGAAWQCGKYGRIIPAEFIPLGCQHWISI